VCLVVIYIIKKNNKINFVIHHVPIVDQKIVGYKKRFRIMNESEAALFFELRKQLPKDCYVFPYMRIADVVDAVNGSGFYRRRNKILPKHLDFVVCNSNFTPIVAIELNGGYHRRPDRIKMDEEKEEILKDAKLPLVTIRVGDSFADAVLSIRSYL